MAPRDPTKSPIFRFGGGFLVVITVVVLLLGVAMLGAKVKLWWDARSFDTVEAVVVSSRAIQRDAASSDHFPVVVYEYEIDGQTYRHSNRDIAPELTKSKATEWAAKYPQGTTVSVFVDPDDPDRSLFSKDVGILSTLAMILAPIGLMVVFVILPMLRARRHARAAQR